MCYCCKENTIRVSMMVISGLIIIPGILLFIFGGLFGKQINGITGSGTAPVSIGQIATYITYLFGAMAIYIGFTGLLIGCCFTKSPKIAKCCACFYTIKSVLFFIVFLILGIVFIAISSMGAKFVDKYCAI